jgi:hypothetical protein
MMKTISPDAKAGELAIAAQEYANTMVAHARASRALSDALNLRDETEKRMNAAKFKLDGLAEHCSKGAP